jgi:uncharacterized membrane protein YqgA involved in biofilm formation
MDENVYLKQWKALKEGGGMESASTKSASLFSVGALLSVVVVLLIYFQVHSSIVAIVSVAIGWIIAERNALNSRIEMWPKLEKYLNWEIINESISK